MCSSAEQLCQNCGSVEEAKYQALSQDKTSTRGLFISMLTTPEWPRLLQLHSMLGNAAWGLCPLDRDSG